MALRKGTWLDGCGCLFLILLLVICSGVLIPPEAIDEMQKPDDGSPTFVVQRAKIVGSEFILELNKPGHMLAVEIYIVTKNGYRIEETSHFLMSSHSGTIREDQRNYHMPLARFVPSDRKTSSAMLTQDKDEFMRSVYNGKVDSVRIVLREGMLSSEKIVCDEFLPSLPYDWSRDPALNAK